MCQPGHLALPNGLLNADIKPALPSCLPQSPPHHPYPSPPPLRSHYFSFSPCPSPCHSLVLSLALALAVSLRRSNPLPRPKLPLSSPSPSLDSFEPFPRLLIPEAFFSPLLKLFFSPFFPPINELDVSPFLGVSSPPFSADRLHNAFYPQDPSFTLTLLHVLTAPLHGLANAFVFSLDGDWRSVLSPSGMQVRPSRTFF